MSNDNPPASTGCPTPKLDAMLEYHKTHPRLDVYSINQMDMRAIAAELAQLREDKERAESINSDLWKNIYKMEKLTLDTKLSNESRLMHILGLINGLCHKYQTTIADYRALISSGRRSTKL
jgi:ABC-type protease/lipase transport system fused ATPase/permease subunit